MPNAATVLSSTKPKKPIRIAVVEDDLASRKLARPRDARDGRYFTASNSTSNTSVALGGMTPPAPLAP